MNLSIINGKSVNICSEGFQTEALIKYCKKMHINVNCVIVDCFTRKPEDCYRIPSKRHAERNSFSEVDMYMDSYINGVVVKRMDQLSDFDTKQLFIVFYDEYYGLSFVPRLEHKNLKYQLLTEDDIREINNELFDSSAIINELWKTNKYLYSEIQRLKHCVRRQLAPTIYDFHFEFHIVEHCNLNCRSCTHFAPLAKEDFLSVEEFEKDISRLSHLTNKQARFINLLGGEPLLHPEINSFMIIARKYFSNAIIRVVTNGVLLAQMDEKFWKTCKENNITIGVTEYPIDIDYKKAINIIKNHGIGFESFSGDDIDRNEMWKIALDKNNLSRPVDNFINCPRANACVFVKHGKIYNCATMANIDHFNNYFGCDYHLSDDDGMDFHKADDINQIFSFLSKPKPFCRFCNIQKRKYGLKWEKSKRQIEEWI